MNHFPIKVSLLIACLGVLTIQIHADESIVDILDNQQPLAQEQLNRFHGYFDRITGISTQALNDFKSLRQQHWPFLYAIANFTFECILSDMKGRDVVIKAEDWHKYLQTYGFPQSDIDEILKRAEKIPSDQLDADRRARLLIFLKGTKHEASLDDVKPARTYLYGSE